MAVSASRLDATPLSDLPIPRSHTLNYGAQAKTEEPKPEAQDPLAHMNDVDKWGLKGFSFMMTNFPDYNGLVTGTDVTNLGFDLNSTE